VSIKEEKNSTPQIQSVTHTGARNGNQGHEEGMAQRRTPRGLQTLVTTACSEGEDACQGDGMSSALQWRRTRARVAMQHSMQGEGRRCITTQDFSGAFCRTLGVRRSEQCASMTRCGWSEGRSCPRLNSPDCNQPCFSVGRTTPRDFSWHRR
jgi:hypothetical protein